MKARKTRAELEKDNETLRRALEALQKEEGLRSSEEFKLNSIISASVGLLKTLRRGDVFSGVLELCRKLIPADAYAIWRKNAETERWEIASASGLSPSYADAIMQRINDGPEPEVELRETFWVEDVFTSSWGASTDDLYRGEGIRSLLVAPLEFQTRAVGTLTFYFKEPRRFSASDTHVASALAALAAGAIGSSELYEEQLVLWNRELDEKLRAAFLAEVGVVLGSSLDYRKTLESIASMAVPYLSDWCVVDILSDGDEVELLAVAHSDPAKIKMARDFRGLYPPDLHGVGPYAITFKTGRSQFIANITPDMLKALPADVRGFLEPLSLSSAMIVPLRVRDRSVGVISFLQAESQRHFTESDLSLAKEMAQRAAFSIDNAILFHRATGVIEARDNLLRKLEKQIRQQAALMAISQRGLSRIDLGALLEDSLFWVTRTLGIDHCVVLELSPDRSEFGVKAASGWGAEEYSLYLRKDGVLPFFQEVLEAAAPVLYDGQQKERQTSDLSPFEGGKSYSAILAPIRPPESTFGLVGAFSSRPNAFSQDDLQFLQSIANIIAASTDHFQTEQALRNSEQKYRQLFDLSPSGILIAGADFLITGANPQALKIFGFPNEEAAVGLDLKPLLFSKRPPQGPESDPQPLGNGVRDWETTLTRLDGTEFPAEVSAEAISDRWGGRVAFFAIVRDITPRKELELMKNDFITTVSHELRTPLTSIAVSLELLAQGRVPRGSDQGGTLIEVAFKNCQRLIHLINEFLDFQKLGSGKFELNVREVDLPALIGQTVVMNQAYAEQYGVRFLVDLEPGETRAAVDPDRFMQILTNLLSNAAKFSTPGGDVPIQLRRGGPRIRISVTNYGPAIPEEFRAKLFGKFVQADSSLNRRHKGSGLGLAISKSLVEEMGGSIDFRSDGQETEFFLEFPALAAQGGST